MMHVVRVHPNNLALVENTFTACMIVLFSTGLGSQAHTSLAIHTVGVKLKFSFSSFVLVPYNAYSAIVSLRRSVYTQQIG